MLVWLGLGAVIALGSEPLADGSMIPGAKLIMVKGGGHSFTITRAEQFNRDLMTFLRGIA